MDKLKERDTLNPTSWRYCTSKVFSFGNQERGLTWSNWRSANTNFRQSEGQVRREGVHGCWMVS